LRPSTFHLHDPHLIPLGVLLKLAGSCVVYDVHEDYPAHAKTKLARHPARAWLKACMWDLLEWVAAKTLDRFVCASPSVAARFPRSRTIVVRNFPIDAGFARASTNGGFHPYAGRPNRVVFHGVISEVRGGWDLLRAIEQVPAHLDCRLRLIGSFKEPDLARMAARADRVDLVPWLPFPEVIRELAAARAGIMLFHPQPNHMDPIRSNKLFEYMAAGIPVIASDIPAWREILVATGCGVVADPSDSAAVAAAIEGVLTNAEEAEAMGARGKAAVRDRFNWDGEAARLVSLYRDLQDGHRSHPNGQPGRVRPYWRTPMPELRERSAGERRGALRRR
jgi:glycosyltransferase involved in cell wall biosynthesis